MTTRASIAAALIICTVAVPFTWGAQVTVTITGEVEYNQIHNGPLNNVSIPSGSPATMTFQLDSNNYTDSSNFPVRGYAIDQSTFTYTLNGVQVGLQNPYPAGETPYFAIRNNDPAVDGFMLTSNVDTGFPEGLPTDEPGIFGQFFDNFYVTYEGTTLNSLDVLGAVGSYDYTGLMVFNWTVDDGMFGPNAMGLLFTQMTITPEPAGLGLFVLGCVGLMRRRR